MIGCLQTHVRKQPIVTLYFEFEIVLNFYNLKARSESDEGNDDDDDDEKCCVCNTWQPADLKKYPYIAIVLWDKCDVCSLDSFEVLL